MLEIEKAQSLVACALISYSLFQNSILSRGNRTFLEIYFANAINGLQRFGRKKGLDKILEQDSAGQLADIMYYFAIYKLNI